MPTRKELLEDLRREVESGNISIDEVPQNARNSLEKEIERTSIGNQLKSTAKDAGEFLGLLENQDGGFTLPEITSGLFEANINRDLNNARRKLAVGQALEAEEQQAVDSSFFDRISGLNLLNKADFIPDKAKSAIRQTVLFPETLTSRFGFTGRNTTEIASLALLEVRAAGAIAKKAGLGALGRILAEGGTAGAVEFGLALSEGEELGTAGRRAAGVAALGGVLGTAIELPNIRLQGLTGSSVEEVEKRIVKEKAHTETKNLIESGEIKESNIPPQFKAPDKLTAEERAQININDAGLDDNPVGFIKDTDPILFQSEQNRFKAPIKPKIEETIETQLTARNRTEKKEGFFKGQKVTALDRNNTGNIVSINKKGSTAKVRFFNKETKTTETVELPFGQLESLEKTRAKAQAEKGQEILEKGKSVEQDEGSIVNLLKRSGLDITQNEGALRFVRSLEGSEVRKTEIDANRKKRLYKRFNSTTADLNRRIVDVTGNFIGFIRDEFGDNAANRIDSARTYALGVNGKSAQISKKLKNDVFKNYNESELKALDFYARGKRQVERGRIQEKRVTEIEDQFQEQIDKGNFDALTQDELDIRLQELKEQQTIRNQGDTDAIDAQQFLDELEKTPDLKKRLEEDTNKIFDTLRTQLDELRNEGIIDEAVYDELVDFDYVQTMFLDKYVDKIDPDTKAIDAGGNQITVGASGLQKTKFGDTGAVETKLETLVNETIIRSQARIAKNKANRELYDIALNNKGNGIMELDKADIDTDLGPVEELNVFIDGKRESIYLPREAAKEWILRDTSANRLHNKVFEWLLGAPILRASATGLNPEFAISNFARDVGYIFLTTDEFSSTAPLFITQITQDLLEVAGDAWRRAGKWEEFVDEGGSFDFLTTEAGFGSGAISGPLQGARQLLGKLGEFSESVTRLAVYNRALKNGKSKREAAYTARSYLDFAQGGATVKALDRYIPYLNVSIQGTRGVLKTAKKNPRLFTYKASQIGATAVGLYYLNTTVNKEAWDQTPQHTKDTNWVITTPFKVKNEDGTEQYRNILIPKDHGQRLIATLFEAIVERSETGKMPSDKVIQSFKNTLPLLPEASLAPGISAYFTYTQNHDFWRNEEVWKGPEVAPSLEFYPNSTHESFIQAGNALNLSPIRLERAASKIFTSGNVFTSAAGLGYSALTGGMSEVEKQLFEKDISEQPFIRRFTKLTPKQDFRVYESIKETSRATNSYRRRNDIALDELVLQVRNGQIEQSELGRFLGSQPVFERERLVRRIKREAQLQRVPEAQRSTMLTLMGIPSPEGRAIEFAKIYRSSNEAKRRELLFSLQVTPGMNTDRFRKEFKRQLR